MSKGPHAVCATQQAADFWNSTPPPVCWCALIGSLLFGTVFKWALLWSSYVYVNFCEKEDPSRSYLWFIYIYPSSSISIIHAYQATKLHVYDPWVPIHQNPCLWSMYIPTHQDTHIYDPVIPINRALYRWLMHTCQPAPYLYMIHAHQPTKIHIYDPSIFANQAPYLWSMHTNQPRFISMIHPYLVTKLHIYDPCIPIHQAHSYDPCIPTKQAPYLWSIHTSKPAPYLSMIHAYQPTKLHIYDPCIPTNYESIARPG